MLGWATSKLEFTNSNSQNSPHPKLEGSHHLPPYSILYASPQGPPLNDILLQDSQMGISKFLKLGLLRLWGPITLCLDLQLRWGLKKSYSFRWELSNGMWHATYKQGSRVDSWFLVVKLPIWLSTFFLAITLCLKCSNESCKPILII
jgi:hypothetical protein